jgi:hypothetical protein
MHYEINVALNGSHYFATDKRSLTTAQKTAEVIADFNKRFPAAEGFSIGVTYYPGVGYGGDVTGDTNVKTLVKELNSLGE